MINKSFAVFKQTIAALCIGAPLSLFIPACAAGSYDTLDTEEDADLPEQMDEDVDSAEQAASASAPLRVWVGNKWVSVGCSGGVAKANGSGDKWKIIDRKLINQAGKYLFCDEGWPDGKKCECTASSSEAYHAITEKDFDVDASKRKHGNSLTTTLAAQGAMYIFPNNAHEFCLAVNADKVIYNKDGGDDGSHHESTHGNKCNKWCYGSGCP